MCRRLIVHHSCTHKSAEIEQCTTVININKNRTAANFRKWTKDAPLPSCSRLRTDVPKCGCHYIWTSLCPSCVKKYGADADLDFVLEAEEKQREIDAIRRRVAKDIQQGKYVQRLPSANPPPSLVAPGQSSIPVLARPKYGHKILESKDFTDMGPDDIGDKYLSYYRSGASSGMAFEHPDVAAHNDSVHSQHSRQRAYDMGERSNKPLPLTPPNEREPIQRKPVPYNSFRQPSPRLHQRERFDADRVHTRRPSPSVQRPTIRIPFQCGSEESSPISDRSADRASWPDANDSARAELKPAPVVPQTPQTARKPLYALDGVSPLHALSALAVESEVVVGSVADDYFVSSHASTCKGKGKALMSSHDNVSPMTRETPKVTVTRPGKSNRVESSTPYDADIGRAQTVHDSPRRFLPRWSSPTPPPQTELHTPQPAAGAGYLSQPSCPWTNPNTITGSPPLLSSAVYNPPPMPPPRDPTDDIPDEVGNDVVGFEALEYRVNVMAAAAAVRTRVEKWQGSSATHSRTHSREENMAPTAHLVPESLQIRTPMQLGMINPAPDGKGGFFDRPI